MQSPVGGIGEFTDFMNQTVTVNAFASASTDGYNKPSWSTCAQSFAARVSSVPGGSRLMRTPDGREVVAVFRVYIATTAAISWRDKLTLPSDYDPRVPIIAAVKPAIDETGAQHHVAVDVGVA